MPLGSALLDGPYCNPQSGRSQYGLQASQLGIAGFGEHLVRRLPCELRLARDFSNAALRLSNMAQREHQRGLVTFLYDCLEVRGGFRRVLELLDQPRLVTKASGDRAASFARCALCSLGNSL